MKNFILALLCLIPLQLTAQIFINEIDYDQPGTDSAEFLELAGAVGTYNNVVVVFINGNNNEEYQTVNLGTITLSDETDGYGFFVIGASSVPNTDHQFEAADNNIQNGAPDAIQVSIGDSIVDAVSYEGSMNDLDGNPTEVATPDESDPYWEGGEGLSIGRLGLDGFPWAVMNITPGEINEGQTLAEGLPLVENVTHTPQAPDETESVTVTAEVTDSDGTIAEVNLYVSINGGEFTSSAMSNTSGDTYEGTISAHPTGTSISYYVEATDNEANTTESTTFGYTVISSTGYAIADIQQTGNAGTGDDCYPSPFAGQQVSISGIVTAVGENMMFLQDADTVWSGVKLFDYGLSLESVGDSISVTGEVEEYYGMTEITGISNVGVLSSGNTVYAPIEVATGDLDTTCSSSGEPYEGMLVILRDVTVTQEANEEYGEWYVDDGSGVCEIEDTMFPYEPTIGEQFDEIIGVVDYGYGHYSVLPRSEDDLIQNANAPNITGVSSAPEFVTSANEIEVRATITPQVGSITNVVIQYGSGGSFPNEESMFVESGDEYIGYIPAQSGNSEIQFRVSAGDSEGNVGQSVSQTVLIANSQPMAISELRSNINTYEDQVVTVGGVVTIGTNVLVDDYTQAYIQDNSGNGVQLYDPDLIEGIDRGGEVLAVGYATVYQQTLEIADFNYTIESTGNPLPEAEVLTIAEANNLVWEGTLIEISGTLGDKWWAGGGTNLKVGSGTDSTIVRVWDVTGIDSTDFSLGTTYWFRGVGSVYGGDPQLLLGYDTDYGTGTAVDPEDRAQPMTFELSEAYPNPFNPSTAVTWQLPQDGHHELAVYNVLGQQIQVLSSGYATAGQHTTRWNATDQPSGIYFIHLTSQGESQVKKVTLLR